MIRLINNNYDKDSTIIRLLCICVFIIFCNLALIGSPINIVITIPQYALVFYLLFKGDIKDAILWHFTFILLSQSSQTVLGMFDGQSYQMYNYGTIKLIGPVRACYFINILLLLFVANKKAYFPKEKLLYKLYKVMLYLAISALIIGFSGLLFNPYYLFSALVDNSIYMFVVITSIYILLCIADESVYRAAYYISICALMAAPIGSVLSYTFLHTTITYGMYDDLILIADLVNFTPILLLGLLFEKKRKIIFFSLLFYVYILGMAVGGKTVFGIAFCAIAVLYFLFLDRETKVNYRKTVKILKPFFVVVVIVVALDIARGGDSMAMYKINSALSMFSGDLSEISRSPYIRVTSLINIIYEGIQNPFLLLFGNGYGGYFEDHFNFFEGMQLENGAWGDADIASGKFHSGHDTMVTAPLFNGMIGLCVLVIISIQYIKRIKNNYLSAMAFLWILLMFYANTLFAYNGVFILFASEYNLNKVKEVNRFNSLTDMQTN